MIDQVQGKLLKKAPSYAVVEVGGIAFKIMIPLTVYERFGDIGSSVRLTTHLHVREDALQLFGFWNEDERTVFEKMLSVSGVGPKLALTILSRFSPSELSDVIAAGDIKRLSSVKGIGQKTAQRLIVEFRDRISLDIITGESMAEGKKSVYSEALQALEALGYSTADADGAVRKTIARLGTESPLEDIIKAALKGG